jgi:hypothetical protein
MMKKFQGEPKGKKSKASHLNSPWIRIFLGLLTPGLLFIIYLGSKIFIGRLQAPEPQLILAPSGSNGVFLSQFAQRNPGLDVWVLSGSENIQKVFRINQISDSRVYLDCRSTDTVTHYTSIVKDLKDHNIKHVYLVILEQKKDREMLLATLLLGSQGIVYTPIFYPESKRYSEADSDFKTLRDLFRSIGWLLTGKTGESFNGRNQEDFCENPGFQRGIQKK